MANQSKKKPPVKPEAVKVYEKVPTPFQDRIIISKYTMPSVSPGGIIIPEAAIPDENRGIVLAVGPTVGKSTGARYVPQYGDMVIFGEYSGIRIEFEGKEFLVVKEADVLAKV